MEDVTFSFIKEVIFSKGFLVSIIVAFVNCLFKTKKIVLLCSNSFTVSCTEKVQIFSRSFLPTVIGIAFIAFLFAICFKPFATTFFYAMEFPLWVMPLSLFIANKIFVSNCSDAYNMIADIFSFIIT